MAFSDYFLLLQISEIVHAATRIATNRDGYFINDEALLAESLVHPGRDNEDEQERDERIRSELKDALGEEQYTVLMSWAMGYEKRTVVK